MKNFLVVDDVEVTRYTVGLYLEALGHSYAEASSPEAARKQLASGRFDGVFLDWHLKKQSGLALIEEIRRAAAKAPIIVISGVEGRDQADSARRAGADSFVTKPMDQTTVAQALKEVGLA